MSIRNFAAASVLLLLLSAGRTWAQANGFDGLDLTDDSKKDDKKPDSKSDPKKKDDKKKPVTPAAGADDGLDLTGDSTADKPDKPLTPVTPSKDEPRKPLVQKEEGPATERDVTRDDRVKSVQRKLYLKRARFELAPYFVLNINDPYYARFGGAIRAAFHPADNLAFSARFTLLQTLPTDDVRTAKKNLFSRIFFSVPYWTAMGDVEWSPLYGKVAFFNSILFVDGYFVAGVGVVYTETSASTDTTRNGPKPGFDLGLGLRFVAKDFLAVNIGLINTTYVDTPAGTNKAGAQNMMMLHAGLSIFFPFKSTYREAE